MRPIYIALISLMAASAVARAQDGTPAKMSVQECIDYAMKHNYAVKNAQLDVLIQKAQNDQTIAAALPSVNGKAELDYYIKPQSSFIDASSFNFDPTKVVPKGTIIPIAFSLNYASSVGVSASQILFDGSVAIALQARNALMELSRQTGKVTETNVRYNVTRSYYSIVVIKNQLDIIKRSLVFGRSIQHDQEAMQQAGFVEKIEIERTAVQMNNLVNDSMRIANLANLTAQVMKYQMGMDINAPIELTDNNLDEHVASSTKLLAEEETYVNVPEYNLSLTSVQLNEYNLKRYKMAALPTLVAIGAYGTNYGENDFGKLWNFRKYEPYSLVGLQLTMPIFNGFKRQKQVQESKLNIEKAKNNLDNIKLTLDFQTTQAKTSLKNALLQLQSQKRNVALAEDVLDLAQKKYKAGVGSNLEVSTAQTEQLQAQNTFFGTMLDIINAETDLKKALGQL